MAWEGAICHLQKKICFFSNFHKGCFVVQQGRRALLCYHRAAGFFVLPWGGMVSFFFFVLPPGSRVL